MDCIMIGIAGGTGSGKSTFTNRLKDRFGDEDYGAVPRQLL